jgi:uncharacterized protein YecT (DUF1311 family)
MTRRRLPALAILAVTLAAAASAFALAGGGASAAPAPRDAYSHCLKHAQSTFAMDQCVGAERTRLKPLLAAAYNKLLHDPTANAHRKHQIALSQKAWLGYEKRDCAYAGSAAEGGTLQPVIEGECLVARTRARIHDLKKFALPLGQ